MKRIVLLVTVALVMALMMGVAAPAFATIHPISNSERSADAADGTPADTQNLPGITGEGHEGNTDPDPDHATEAQPLVSHLSNKTDNDCNAWKEGQEFCQAS
jgi:uncharacterized low-complexity protein